MAALMLLTILVWWRKAKNSSLS